jgi:hypothetical protein
MTSEKKFKIINIELPTYGISRSKTLVKLFPCSIAKTIKISTKWGHSPMQNKV